MMGVEWSFYRADPTTFERLDDNSFDPHPFEPEEIDLVLVGNTDGPIMDAMKECREVSNRAVMGMPLHTVRDLMKRLGNIARSDFSPINVVLRQCLHTLETSDEHNFYDELASTAKQLQDFVAKANSTNCAIRIELRGV